MKLASTVYDQLAPTVERLRAVVASQNRFALTDSGVIGGDGDRLGRIGIRCEQVRGSCLVSLSFGVVLLRPDLERLPIARCTVLWTSGPKPPSKDRSEINEAESDAV